MSNSNKINSLSARLEVVKTRVDSTPKVSAEEKEKIRAIIQNIADSLSEILEDETISVDVKEKLEKETRKQIVFINKAIDLLQTTIEISKKYID